MRGMEDAAGGVFSVNSNNSKKNATNMFIPARDNKIIMNYKMENTCVYVIAACIIGNHVKTYSQPKMP